MALGAVATVVVVTHAGADGDQCATFRTAAADRSALVTGTGEDVLVIGDSYSVGLGVAAGESWPTRLPGRVRVDGFSGSGFSPGASGCGDVSYAARAPRSLRPDTSLVVAEGGLNDADQPPAEVAAGFRALMRDLAGHRVLVVGPPAAPARADRVPAVDALLARLAERHGASYLSMAEHDFPYLDDGLHLTPDGHRAFGDVVAAALAAGHTDRSASVGGTAAARAAG